MRAACTIIAKNYLAFARTLAQSFVSAQPHTKFYVLVVDEIDGYIDREAESFETIRLSELNILNVQSLCFKYSVKELCTAVKARLLNYLLCHKGVDELLYLDPDILVTNNLDDLFDKLRTYDILLTPHLDTDYPNDGLLPDDSYILRAGQFNLGFIGVNSTQNSKSFLEWWKEKLDEHCVVDVSNGYFVDQKFIDFVPTLFDNFHIQRDTGYNVAYWNLHSRRLSKTNGTWRCNDAPLYFFHFSGYKPDTSAVSSHIPLSVARQTLSNRTDLKELFADYKALLLKNGHSTSRTWPYTYGVFASGSKIPDSVRRYYLMLGNKRNGLGDPFESEELMKLAQCGAEDLLRESSATTQLDSILNSRAWRWVSRYGRFKNRVTGGFGGNS